MSSVAPTLSFKEAFNSVNKTNLIICFAWYDGSTKMYSCSRYFKNKNWETTKRKKNPTTCYTKYALLIVEAIYCHCTVVILKIAHLVLSVNYLALASIRYFFLFLLECIMCAF